MSSLETEKVMIKINNLCTGYGAKQVLHDVNIDFVEGEFTFLLGPNGAGKSTLLRSINSLLKAFSGDILVNNKSIKKWSEKELAKQIAFIPQNFTLHFDFMVYDFILMARFPWQSYMGNYSHHNLGDGMTT